MGPSWVHLEDHDVVRYLQEWEHFQWISLHFKGMIEMTISWVLGLLCLPISKSPFNSLSNNVFYSLI
jgi:hypothetical protein